ncbi:hypothetical protein B5M09_006780 [Aphanomyces astaci]|uniref:Integrator complex subunit 7 n=1 Tax=Aphanomyces astaci TaxID=112090 RepID=A0A425DHN6_APHAT|nr:hypothetical protein B5M09_006780 [Aphanomyces astaci]
MASEPAWACVASSAFPLIYSYSKDLTLGGTRSRSMEKDHVKLIQALEQQLKLKGRSVANKAETLFFYSHFPFLTPIELELVLLRLSEQFCAPTSSTSFRVAILALFERLQGHFPNKSISDVSKVPRKDALVHVSCNLVTFQITTPIAQVVAQHDLVETRVLALRVLAILAPFCRDDATAHTAYASLPEDLTVPRQLFARQAAPRASAIFARMLFHQARHQPLSIDGDHRPTTSSAAASVAVTCLVQVLVEAPVKIQPTIIKVVEGLATSCPRVATALLSRLCQALLESNCLSSASAMWVLVSHLASIGSVPDTIQAAIVATVPSKWTANESTTALAMVVTLLRSGGGYSSADSRRQGILVAMTTHDDSYALYQTARECILHGAFDIATNILSRVKAHCASERTGHWMAALHAWTSAEGLLMSQPSIVPSVGLVQIAGTSSSVGASSSAQRRRLGDVARDFTLHATTVLSLGRASWSHEDLLLLAAHGHLCHVLHDAVHRFFVMPPLNSSETPVHQPHSIRQWPGSVAGTCHRLTTPSPLWHFCNALDSELPHVPVPASLRDAAALVVDLARAAIAVPCAIPRQFFRTTSVDVPCDVQIASASLKMMSRSVLGLAAHTPTCHGHLHVSMDLAHARHGSPLRDHMSPSWRLVFEGALDNGFAFTTHAEYAHDGKKRWQGALPLQVDAGGFGAQGTSCALIGHLWLVNSHERWLVAERVLERTVVVY